MGNLCLVDVSILLLPNVHHHVNRTRIHDLFYQSPRQLAIPKSPIPGHNPTGRISHGDKARISAANSSPLDFRGQTFEAICKLAVIVQEMTLRYYERTEVPLSERVPLTSAESMYQKLLAWADTLPQCLARSDHCHDHVMVFQ